MDKERYAQYLDSLSRVLEDWERFMKTTSVEQMIKKTGMNLTKSAT